MPGNNLSVSTRSANRNANSIYISKEAEPQLRRALLNRRAVELSSGETVPKSTKPAIKPKPKLDLKETVDKEKPVQSLAVKTAILNSMLAKGQTYCGLVKEKPSQNFNVVFTLIHNMGMLSDFSNSVENILDEYCPYLQDNEQGRKEGFACFTKYLQLLRHHIEQNEPTDTKYADLSNREFIDAHDVLSDLGTFIGYSFLKNYVDQSDGVALTSSFLRHIIGEKDVEYINLDDLKSYDIIASKDKKLRTSSEHFSAMSNGNYTKNLDLEQIPVDDIKKKFVVVARRNIVSDPGILKNPACLVIEGDNGHLELKSFVIATNQVGKDSPRFHEAVGIIDTSKNRLTYIDDDVKVVVDISKNMEELTELLSLATTLVYEKVENPK